MKEKCLYLLLFLVFILSGAACAQGANENIAVHNAWIRWQPPSRDNSAVFMTIENNSKTQMALKSVASKSVANVELHTMEHVDGVMKMHQIESIVIPAGSEVELKPGGIHLMLFGIKKPLELGEKMPFTLNFQDGSIVEIEAVVKGQDEE